MNIFVDQINERLTMCDLLERYTEIGNGKRTRCHFHGGDSRRSLCYNDRVYKCHVCGKSGNIWTFMKDTFRININQAIYKLNYDFQLGLDVGREPTMREQKAYREKERKRKAKIQMEKDVKELWDEIRNDNLDEYARLERNKKEYAPKTMWEPWDFRFVEALRKLDYMKYKLDYLGW